MRFNVNLFYIRHAISTGIAVLIAVMFQYYYAMSQGGWLILTTFLVTQTTRGTPLGQNLKFLAVILFATAIATITSYYLSMTNSYLMIGAVFIVGSMALYQNRIARDLTYWLLLAFVLVYMVAVLQSITSMDELKYRVMDILLGSMIGVLAGQFIFPVKIAKEFQQGLLPLLETMMQFLKEVSYAITNKEQQKLSIDHLLTVQQATYPEWVYESGFNHGLRAGFRFFLVHLERVSDLFVSLAGVFTKENQIDLPDELRESALNVIEVNSKLLTILKYYFIHNEIKDIEGDFKSDINTLELALKRVVPVSIEMLDYADENMRLADFVRNLKDTRELLLKLVMTLPVRNVHSS